MRLFRHSCWLMTALPSLILAAAAVHPLTPKKLSWILKPTNSTQQFRGLSPVSDNIIWVSGTNGTVLRSTNAGLSWNDVSPTFLPTENTSDFQFRDIQAWSAESAVILSIGEGNASRTQNGGSSWDLTFVNGEPTAFYDCMAFEGKRSAHGLAMSDPVGGRFRLLETWDRGAHWKILDTNQTMPPALEGEFAFAASGTCIEAVAGRWYIGTGGVDPGRIFRSTDPTKNWQTSNSSIAGGEAAGVFSVRFRDAKSGIAVGGDYENPTVNINIAAWSQDGGALWREADSFPGGYRSSVSWVPERRHVAVAVGTSGSDITVDEGKNWASISNGTFDVVECVDKYTCWASGSRGRVAKLSLKGI